MLLNLRFYTELSTTVDTYYDVDTCAISMENGGKYELTALIRHGKMQSIQIIGFGTAEDELRTMFNRKKRFATKINICQIRIDGAIIHENRDKLKRLRGYRDSLSLGKEGAF